MSSPVLLKNKTGINGLGAGVWNLGPGGDPFGGPTRESIPILDRLPLIAESGMSFYEAHDVEITAEMAPRAAKRAKSLGLEVHAGHGLDYTTAATISGLSEIVELNIGHFLVGEALFIGLAESVRRMRVKIDRAREILRHSDTESEVGSTS